MHRAFLPLETERLRLRAWRPQDRAAFAAINADPEVMTYFAAPLTQEESDEAMHRYNMQLARDGFTMFAAEDRTTSELLGLLGMQVMRDVVPTLPQPAVEIGWRLKRSAWGCGLAPEGARAVLDLAFNTFRLPSVVAVTTTANGQSRRVMEKLGMTYRPELDFLHPRIPAGHPNQPHVLYERSAPN